MICRTSVRVFLLTDEFMFYGARVAAYRHNF